MPTILGELHFDSTEQGWSEGYYLGAADSLETALTKLVNLANDRIKLCGVGVSIDGISVSDVDVVGDSLVSPVLLTTVRGTDPESIAAVGPAAVPVVPALNSQCDMPYMAMLIRADSLGTTVNPGGGADPIPSGRRRKDIFMRGIPDELVTGVSKRQRRQRWESALRDFQATLKNDGWGFRVILRKPVLDQLIVGWTINVGGEIVVELPVATAAKVGDTVKVRDAVLVNGTFRANRLYRVHAIEVGGKNVHLLDVHGKPLVGTFATSITGGKLYIVQNFTAVAPIASITPIRPTHRKTGRPFGLSPGRRTVRK